MKSSFNRKDKLRHLHRLGGGGTEEITVHPSEIWTHKNDVTSPLLIHVSG